MIDDIQLLSNDSNLILEMVLLSKTDFFLPKDKPRPYLEIFNKMIDHEHKEDDN